MPDVTGDNPVLKNDDGKECKNDEPLKISEWYFVPAIKQTKAKRISLIKYLKQKRKHFEKDTIKALKKGILIILTYQFE